jgi:hypothetical protein
MKKISIVFVSAFLLNLVWENIHALLYDNYMGREITRFILFRASLADAVMITLILLPFLFISVFKKHIWLIVLIGFVLSVGIEIWALNTARWSYNEYMPIVPILSVGLTPIIQLGLLGFITYKIQDYLTHDSEA